MTTATDHKNLNRSVLKKDYARTLRVETIANSTGGTAQVSIVAQPSIGFPETPNTTPMVVYGRYGRLPRPNHCRTHPVQIVDPSMAQVIAIIAYGIRGLQRGETTWDWPDFDADPEQENLAQLSRWSLNSAPAA